MSKTKNVPFTFLKDGIYYFTRRVPSDLRDRYLADRISYSLRTRSCLKAATKAAKSAQQLDEHWHFLRMNGAELPGRHLLRIAAVPTESAAPVGLNETEDICLLLSEAMSLYLRLKGADRPKTFSLAVERCCGEVMDVCGDKDFASYTKRDANQYRDALLAKGLRGSSITRTLGTVRAVFNFAASETGISIQNPFASVFHDRRAGVTDRQPIPMEIVRSLQQECRRIDDEKRWLIALISDTGMRLAEAAGLHGEDIVLNDAPVPHIIVREHPWRRLKTAGSGRAVPLVGASLWAAQRVVEGDQHRTFAFPSYSSDTYTNANSASAALNKWMKPRGPEGCSMHSFRHTLRDRLRQAECPSDIADQLGGWKTSGVGHSYGNGYPLEVLAKWMRAIALP